MAYAAKVDLGLHGETVALGSHIAYLWETQEQFAEAVAFLEVGLRSNDHGVVFGFEDACTDVCQALTARGWDVPKLQAEGKLSIINGAESGAAMLTKIGAGFQEALDGGAQVIRLLGNIGWGRHGWPSEEEILQFEAKVTGAAEAFPCVVVCMYDVGKLSAEVLLHGAFETHPLTICGNLLRENPYFVPVEEFLNRYQPAAATAE